ncbi:SPOR domain-containing protein [Novosphingobium sp. SL115]|uniref:SPOR domain-containing protein n=1 Tax=Novosphingobium sp. SL115 TaxID=2995150 RepID=UPI0022735343|nr:SPOR domain-containing protein [Novosphingobium sp. SL115]MCY1672374.1 SPOR domain-containing protein [Novosphingobium sp. SL115]
MHGDNDDQTWGEQGPEGQGAGKPFNVSAELDHVSGVAADAASDAVASGADVLKSAAASVTAAASGVLASGNDRLALGDNESLPWLESADDLDADAEDAGNGRLIGFAVMGLVVLAALIGGIYWASNRGTGPANADGSLIEASKAPYKVAPSDPGGKTFAGTGDSSFKVSEGEKPGATLAGSAAAAPSASASAAPKPNAVATPKPAAGTGGIGVQVGAYSSSATAEAGWNKLASTHESLKGLSHRVIEGKADIGTVYRLQAVAADVSAANALCQKLQAGGLKCQVKR